MIIVRLARQTRELTVEYLGRAFEMPRDSLLRQLGAVRSQHASAQVGLKIGQLRKAVEEEMVRQAAAYKHMCDEYLRQRNASSEPGADKKLTSPRKSVCLGGSCRLTLEGAAMSFRHHRV